MNPTPEQLAFAFAMMTLKRSDNNEPPLVSSSFLSGLFRLVAIAVVGLGTGLLGMTYIEGTVASNGFSHAEIRSFGDPSPYYSEAVTSTSEEPAAIDRTAFAR